MLILALDSALWTSSVTLLRDQVEFARREALPGSAGEVLAELTAELLESEAIKPEALGLIAVTVGPGSYTGVRGGMAVAQGLGLSTGIEVVGVSVGEALAAAVENETGGRPVWSFSGAKRGELLTMEADGVARIIEPAQIPVPPGPVAVAGDAAIAAAARMAARGDNILLSSARLPTGIAIGRVALRRQSGEISPRVLAPLYVDAYVDA